VLTIVGARPQFVKAAVVSGPLRAHHTEILLHTGQHYDDAMSDRFFRDLNLPRPDYMLGVGSGSHGAQTAQMLVGIEQAIELEHPDCVLIYGDTNSTLAGALAAAKLHVPVAHVEAGLRSYNREMPEEINRIVADRLSDLLFCPSQVSAQNLAKEGITCGVHVVGDVMADALRCFGSGDGVANASLKKLNIEPRQYYLATVHRAQNTDNPQLLGAIIDALGSLDAPVVLPAHPRLRESLKRQEIAPGTNVRVVDPVGYVEMIALERQARAILTDSGGVQKEAYWLGVPCVTMRDETEWVETVEAGWNVLTGADSSKIIDAVRRLNPPAVRPPLYGEGGAALAIANRLAAIA
jgi:UDP-N-acetylglucosamine 2-epimerase